MDTAPRTDKPTADWMEDLRQEAERQRAERHQPKPSLRADELLEELQIHQIELEMQNEALRQSQLELEQSRDRYQELYDFAPVGYMTITRAGLIQEVNLTCGKLLGRTRSELIKRYFASLIAREDADCWYLFLMNALKKDAASGIHLTLLLIDDTPHFDSADVCPILGGRKSRGAAHGAHRHQRAKTG